MASGRLPIFRERFNMLRGAMTQKQFAELLGFSRPTVALYESGERIPDAIALKTIAEKCGVSVDWLLGIRNTSIKTSDELINDICQYTGLRENAVKTLNSCICFDDESRPGPQLSDVINYMLSDCGFNEEVIDVLRTAYMVAHPMKKTEEMQSILEQAIKSGYTLLPEYEASDLYINLALQALYSIFREMIDKPAGEIIMDSKRGVNDGKHSED